MDSILVGWWGGGACRHTLWRDTTRHLVVACGPCLVIHAPHFRHRMSAHPLLVLAVADALAKGWCPSRALQDHEGSRLLYAASGAALAQRQGSWGGGGGECALRIARDVRQLASPGSHLVCALVVVGSLAPRLPQWAELDLTIRDGATCSSLLSRATLLVIRARCPFSLVFGALPAYNIGACPSYAIANTRHSGAQGAWLRSAFG